MWADCSSSPLAPEPILLWFENFSVNFQILISMSFQCSASSVSGLHLYFAIFDVIFILYFLISLHSWKHWHTYFFLPVKVVTVLFLNFILRYKIVVMLIFNRTLKWTDWLIFLTTETNKQNLSACWDCLEFWFWIWGGKKVWKFLWFTSCFCQKVSWSPWKMMFQFCFIFQSLYYW